MSRKKVAILYRYIPQYRLEFYKHVYTLCSKNDIDLKVIYGNPNVDDSKKGDSVDFEHGIFVRNHFYSIMNTELVWQPVLMEIKSADLVVVEQANKLLINYILFIRQLLGLQKFAFWGHGKNFQATKRNRISEQFKKFTLKLPHWWFAYTPGVAELITERGFPRDRISILNNAIDTRSLEDFRADIKREELDELRNRNGIKSQNVGIYIGGMYPEKRLEFLTEACTQVRSLIPDFHMIFIGSGKDDHIVRDFCTKHSWALNLGCVFGRDKAKYSMISKLMLMPGLVGLAVLDAFTLGVPIVTTDVKFHSPEIEYIENGLNGVIVTPANDPALYATVVADLLSDEPRRQGLVEGCRQSTSLYTIENMAQRFFDGIVRALSSGG